MTSMTPSLGGGGSDASAAGAEDLRLRALVEQTPQQLVSFLTRTMEAELMTPIMIWGPPGIGKSAIVAMVAAERQMRLIDVRLSQLAPTDLRGLPVAEQGVARWYPPEFLPQADAQHSAGILFLDEINMAPPAIQAITQQLILDRRIGNYQLPAAWRILAAGNRKEDRAAVFDMPTPVANRMLHVSVRPDWDSFRAYALAQRMSDALLGFIAQSPETRLHRLDPNQPAWPSPRTWMLAEPLFRANLPIAPAVGAAMAHEFEAFRALYAQLPQIDRILAGHGQDVGWPTENHLCYVTVLALIARAKDVREAARAVTWLVQAADRSREWSTRFLVDYLPLATKREEYGLFVTALQQHPEAMEAFQAYSATVAQAYG